jgi:hypothetical protein
MALVLLLGLSCDISERFRSVLDRAAGLLRGLARRVRRMRRVHWVHWVHWVRRLDDGDLEAHGFSYMFAAVNWLR